MGKETYRPKLFAAALRHRRDEEGDMRLLNALATLAGLVNALIRITLGCHSKHLETFSSRPPLLTEH